MQRKNSVFLGVSAVTTPHQRGVRFALPCKGGRVPDGALGSIPNWEGA